MLAALMIALRGSDRHMAVVALLGQQTLLEIVK